MARAGGPLTAALGLVPAAPGQTPSFVYSIQPLSSVLTPGQTTTVTVLCGFSPGVGQLISTPIGPRPVLGLSSGSNQVNATAGGWSQVVFLPPFNVIGGPNYWINGPNMGAIWGNGFGPPFGTVSTVNPTPIWQATYTAPTAPGPITLTPVPVGAHGVWAGLPGEISVEVLSTQTSGTQAIITVIPAPASLALLGAGCFAASRRRGSAA